jgi:hypothetical protein
VATRSDQTTPLLRRGLLWLGALTTLGTTVELAAERHWTQPIMWLAWAAVVAVAGALALLAGHPPAARVRLARILAAVVIAIALVGIGEHVYANFDAGGLDRDYAKQLGQPAAGHALVAGRLQDGRSIATARARRAGSGGDLRAPGDRAAPRADEVGQLRRLCSPSGRSNLRASRSRAFDEPLWLALGCLESELGRSLEAGSPAQDVPRCPGVGWSRMHPPVRRDPRPASAPGLSTPPPVLPTTRLPGHCPGRPEFAMLDR